MNCKQLFTEINNKLDSKNSFELNNISVNKTIVVNNKYGNQTFIEATASIEDSNFKLTLKIPKSAIKKATKRYGELVPAQYNLECENISVSNYGQITAHVIAIEKTGESLRDVRNKELYKFAKKHRLLKRRRKKLPSKVESILCLTSKGSDIKNDIVANTGLRAKNIAVYNCYSDQVLANKIMNAKNVDCIVLYRGGHEDEGMGMFSTKEVLLAIANSAIPVCAALGHDQDRPFVYQVADLTYSTPSSFAKSIHLHNKQRGYKALKLFIILWMGISAYLYFG